MSAERSRAERADPLLGVLDPLSGDAKLPRSACLAGARPAPSPASTETIPRKRYTRMSGAKSIDAGTRATLARIGTSQTVKSNPVTPPTSPSERLSVMSCRTMRPRLAPSASRTPISR